MLFSSSSQDIYAYRSLYIFQITRRSTYELQLKTLLINKHTILLSLIWYERVLHKNYRAVKFYNTACMLIF